MLDVHSHEGNSSDSLSVTDMYHARVNLLILSFICTYNKIVFVSGGIYYVVLLVFMLPMHMNVFLHESLHITFCVYAYTFLWPPVESCDSRSSLDQLGKPVSRVCVNVLVLFVTHYRKGTILDDISFSKNG